MQYSIYLFIHCLLSWGHRAWSFCSLMSFRLWLTLNKCFSIGCMNEHPCDLIWHIIFSLKPIVSPICLLPVLWKCKLQPGVIHHVCFIPSKQFFTETCCLHPQNHVTKSLSLGLRQEHFVIFFIIFHFTLYSHSNLLHFLGNSFSYTKYMFLILHPFMMSRKCPQ